MRMLLVGALGMLALEVLLVGGYLAASSQDPFILNPNSGSLEEDGITMVMLCGQGHTPEGRLSEVLSKMPPDGDIGGWSRGRTLRGDCGIWYHHNIFYNPHGESNGPSRRWPLSLIHQSAWNKNSQKVISKILHSPAPLELVTPMYGYARLRILP
jgi:hypothetical protein